ncbi:MAG: hypothetical protein ACT4O2_02815 [Beijerinckiaceae bacterium]
MSDETAIRERYKAMGSRLDERGRRLFAAIRRPCGGRPSATRKDPTLLDDLRKLLEPTTRGDPMRPLLWVSKSHAKLAQALREMVKANMVLSVAGHARSSC